MPNSPTLHFAKDSQRLGVTLLSRELFRELGIPTDLDSKLWRRQYQSFFVTACEAELSKPQQLERALEVFRSLAFFGSEPLEQAMRRATTENLIEIRSVGEVSKKMVVKPGGRTWFEQAEIMVSNSIAEPGLLAAAHELDSGISLENAPLLIAFAGAAELAPTLNWLRWGGRVLVLARQNPTNWQKLIDQAKKSGQLLVPARVGASGDLADIAGMDLTAEPELVSAAIAALPKEDRVIFGNYAYAPAFKHVELQVVAEVALAIAKEKFKNVHLSWLATPSDSVLVPTDLHADRVQRFESRSRFRKLLDSIWQIFGYLQMPKSYSLSNSEFCVLDASVNLQGPSYSLAKRVQRWRATLELQSGGTASYQITPPAQTDSVLRFKTLRSTYRGATLFGTDHLSAEDASAWPAALLALESQRPYETSLPNAYLDRAIHGGLWRTAYETASIWIPTTLLGFFRFWVK